GPSATCLGCQPVGQTLKIWLGVLSVTLAPVPLSTAPFSVPPHSLWMPPPPMVAVLAGVLLPPCHVSVLPGSLWMAAPPPLAPPAVLLRPLPVQAQPNWLVPANTDQLAVAAQGTVPITMGVEHEYGGPNVRGASFGNNSVAVLAAPEIAPASFFGLPEATGPFTSPINGRVNLAAFANPNPFDPAVSASSGDVWAFSVNPNATYTPVSIGPGQTRTITLTFTPNAPKGTVVRGFIGVDTFNLVSFGGDELTNIPYS